MSRFVFTVALVCAAPAYSETAYFAATEDLPLPQGFSEIEGWSMDTGEGRLTEMRAEGPGNADAVRAFYIETLPALGWSISPHSDQTLEFVRDRERLMFAFSAPAPGRAFVRVRLIARSAPAS